MYNLTARTAEPVLEACEAQGLGFIPWFPLAAGPLAAPGGPLERLAADHHASASQLALAWLLKRSPVMLPIPRHVEGRSSGTERGRSRDRALR